MIWDLLFVVLPRYIAGTILCLVTPYNVRKRWFEDCYCDQPGKKHWSHGYGFDEGQRETCPGCAKAHEWSKTFRSRLGRIEFGHWGYPTLWSEDARREAR